MDNPTFIGIDLGTSGCRACLIDTDENLLDEVRASFPEPIITGNKVEQDPQIWWDVVQSVLTELCQHPAARSLAAISVDATSSTVLVTDENYQPLSPALMYNDSHSKAEALLVESIVPIEFSAVYGASSSLSKSLWLLKEVPTSKKILHQADFIIGKLSGKYVSDFNNCLKLGFDPESENWPDWLEELSIPKQLLPEVYPPGTAIGHLTTANQKQLGLNKAVQIVSGTTDSIAGFLATGASKIGDSVTSLGSTVVIKSFSDKPVNSTKQGIYSHKINNIWLVGGASNAGTSILRQDFNNETLSELSEQLNFNEPTQLDYYPLLKPGERFPTYNPDKTPVLTPRPNDRVYLQAVLESLTAIEKRGYEVLHQKGLPKPKRIFTVGGGTKNKKWMEYRAQQLGSDVIIPNYTEACYGTALLAKQGYVQSINTKEHP